MLRFRKNLPPPPIRYLTGIALIHFFRLVCQQQFMIIFSLLAFYMYTCNFYAISIALVDSSSGQIIITQRFHKLLGRFHYAVPPKFESWEEEVTKHFERKHYLIRQNHQKIKFLEPVKCLRHIKEKEMSRVLCKSHFPIKGQQFSPLLTALKRLQIVTVLTEKLLWVVTRELVTHYYSQLNCWTRVKHFALDLMCQHIILNLLTILTLLIQRFM